MHTYAGTLIVDNVPSSHQVTSRTPTVHTLLATHVAIQQHQEANVNGVRHDSAGSRFGSEQLKLRAEPADKQTVESLSDWSAEACGGGFA